MCATSASSNAPPLPLAQARGRTASDPLWERVLHESALHSERIRDELGAKDAGAWNPPVGESEQKSAKARGVPL